MTDTIIYQSPTIARDPYQVGGTLEGWQDVANLALGNSRLTFALSSAFAGPLMHLTHMEGGGFHYRGGSSTGKTTALVAAASVWGGPNYVQTWRATDNGLEGVAQMHCDTLLCLDEMGQVASNKIGDIAYMLANGSGKQRANRGGQAREVATWRVFFLSTGEHSLGDKMSEDGRGRKSAAGQEIRVLDIPADAGASLGLFENLHGFANGDQLSRHLKTQSKTHYGHAARMYLEKIVDQKDSVTESACAFIQEFIDEVCVGDVDGQVRRAAGRFALVAAGGEIAIQLGIAPWPEQSAVDAAKRLFADWVVNRGGVDSAEERKALDAVKAFIDAHGASRFEGLGDLAAKDEIGQPIEQRIYNRAGYKKRDIESGIEHLISPSTWRDEICRGLDPRFVGDVLAKHEHLRLPSGKGHQIKTRIPGTSTPQNFYAVRSTLLSHA